MSQYLVIARHNLNKGACLYTVLAKSGTDAIEVVTAFARDQGKRTYSIRAIELPLDKQIVELGDLE